MYEALYVRMNTICRNKLCDMINGNLNATKEWIEQEFRLEKKDVKVPMVLVKAIGDKAESQSTDPLRDFLPSVTSVNAYIDKQSVQVGTSSEKINLEYLKKNKIISKSVTQFKVLGNGELNSKLNIEADFSSKSAIQKVEKAGGSILVKSNKD